MTDNRDSAGRFRKGRSGNPTGKAPSAFRRKEKLWALEDEALRVLRERLAENDTTAATWLLSRLHPPPKPISEPVSIKLPSGKSLAEQGEAILKQLASGNMSADDCSALISALMAQHRLVEQSEVLPLLERLEAEWRERQNHPIGARHEP